MFSPCHRMQKNSLATLKIAAEFFWRDYGGTKNLVMIQVMVKTRASLKRKRNDNH